MNTNEQRQITENYIKICKRKTEFAKKYIVKEKINCNSCKEDECTFIIPPYYCNVGMAEINEEMPVSINKLNRPNKSIEQWLDEAGF